MNPRTVHLVTGNPAKVAFAQKECTPYEIEIIHSPLPLIEPQFDTIEEVSMAKARQAFEQLYAPVMVEDGGLAIPALNNFPGPYAKYVFDTVGCEGILRLMNGIGDRRTWYTNCITFIDANGEARQFTSTAFRGRVADHVFPPSDKPMWSAAWQIFIPTGFDKALSQLTPDEWLESYKINEAKPIFAHFAEWYGSAEKAA